jgi:hypothetical protein
MKPAQKHKSNTKTVNIYKIGTLNKNKNNTASVRKSTVN